MKKEKRKYFLLIFMSLLVMICQQLVTERFFQKEHFSFHQRAYMEGHRSWREGDSGRPFRRDKEAFFSKSGMPPRPIILPNNLPSQDTFFEDDHPVMIAGMPSFVVFMVIRKTLTSSLLLLLVGSFLKLSSVWSAVEIEKEKLQRENLDAELKLLKAQVNPHFLFNTLNSIYALSHKKEKEVAKAILKLSGIMRYMIYDTTSETVALEKEMEYIENYIALQRLRLPAFIEIKFRATGITPGHGIEPMLLLPFIENAFKHGISYAQASVIDICIGVEQNILRLEMSNPVFPQTPSSLQGGVGLGNIKRRLQLLYGQNYQLTVEIREQRYWVMLELELNHYKPT